MIIKIDKNYERGECVCGTPLCKKLAHRFRNISDARGDKILMPSLNGTRDIAKRQKLVDVTSRALKIEVDDVQSTKDGARKKSRRVALLHYHPTVLQNRVENTKMVRVSILQQNGLWGRVGYTSNDELELPNTEEKVCYISPCYALSDVMEDCKLAEQEAKAAKPSVSQIDTQDGQLALREGPSPRQFSFLPPPLYQAPMTQYPASEVPVYPNQAVLGSFQVAPPGAIVPQPSTQLGLPRYPGFPNVFQTVTPGTLVPKRLAQLGQYCYPPLVPPEGLQSCVASHALPPNPTILLNFTVSNDNRTVVVNNHKGDKNGDLDMDFLKARASTYEDRLSKLAKRNEELTDMIYQLKEDKKSDDRKSDEKGAQEGRDIEVLSKRTEELCETINLLLQETNKKGEEASSIQALAANLARIEKERESEEVAFQTKLSQLEGSLLEANKREQEIAETFLKKLAEAEKREKESAETLNKKLEEAEDDRFRAEKRADRLSNRLEATNQNHLRMHMQICRKYKDEIRSKTELLQIALASNEENNKESKKLRARNQELEEKLQYTPCPICLTARRDRVFIPCGHTFCGACMADLKRLWRRKKKQQRERVCPYCKGCGTFISFFPG